MPSKIEYLSESEGIFCKIKQSYFLSIINDKEQTNLSLTNILKVTSLMLMMIGRKVI